MLNVVPDFLSSIHTPALLRLIATFGFHQINGYHRQVLVKFVVILAAVGVESDHFSLLRNLVVYLYSYFLIDINLIFNFLLNVAAVTTTPTILPGGVLPSIQLTPEKTIMIASDLRGTGSQRPPDGTVDPNLQSPFAAAGSSLQQNEIRPPSEQPTHEAITVATEEDRDDWEEDDIVDEPDDDSEDSYYEATYRKRKRASAKAFYKIHQFVLNEKSLFINLLNRTLGGLARKKEE
jgi:hypothetical protein